MAFLHVYSNGELKYTVELKPDTTTIGRTADNDVIIDNPGVSARHAVIVHDRATDIYYLEPEKGAKVRVNNAKIIGEYELQNLDRIDVHGVNLSFYSSPTGHSAVTRS